MWPQLCLLAFLCSICHEVMGLPVTQQNSESLLPETEITGSAIEASSALLGSEGKGKAGSSPSPIPGPENLTGMVPGPIKDRIPGAISGVSGSSSNTPTLIIGGFSVMVIPMPNGIGDFTQFMQGAPSIMALAPPVGG